MTDGVEFPADVPGAAELVAQFGSWPSFHDAEVRSVHLNREGPSRIRVGTKQVVVTFVLGGVTELALNGFNGRNGLSALTLTKNSSGLSLSRLRKARVWNMRSRARAISAGSIPAASAWVVLSQSGALMR